MPLYFALSIVTAAPAVCALLLCAGVMVVMVAVTNGVKIHSDIQFLQELHDSSYAGQNSPSPDFAPEGLSAVQFSAQLALLCQRRDQALVAQNEQQNEPVVVSTRS